MLKNILKINGAQQLNRSEQRSITGGGSSGTQCMADLECRLQFGPCFVCTPDLNFPGQKVCFEFNENANCQQ